jgi:hypothetical protein
MHDIQHTQKTNCSEYLINSYEQIELLPLLRLENLCGSYAHQLNRLEAQ